MRGRALVHPSVGEWGEGEIEFGRGRRLGMAARVTNYDQTYQAGPEEGLEKVRRTEEGDRPGEV